MSVQGVIRGFGAPGSLGAFGVFKPTSSQSAAFLTRTSGLTNLQKATYDALISGLVTDGVYANLDVLHIMAAPNAPTSLLNLISTSYPITMQGVVPFTPFNGYDDFSNANYLDPGYNPTTAVTPKFTQNSATVGTWTLENSENAATIGNNSATNEISIWPRNGGRFYASLNGSDDPSGIANLNSIGMFAASRTASTGYSFYQNAANVSTRLNTSNAIPNHGIFYGGGMPSFGFYSANIAAAFIGGGMSDAQMLALYNRLNAFFQAMIGLASWADSMLTTGASSMATSTFGLLGVADSKVRVITDGTHGGDTSAQIVTRLLAADANIRRACSIFCGGINDDYTNMTAVNNNTQQWWDSISGSKYVLTLSPGDYAYEYVGGAGRPYIDAINAERRLRYGNRCVDVTTPWLNAASPSGAYPDPTNYAKGIPPAATLFDQRHPNDPGHNIRFAALRSAMIANGDLT